MAARFAVALALVACGHKKDKPANDHAPAPAPVASPRKVVKIAAGDGTACAVTDNGRVRCWGRNAAATPFEIGNVAGAIDVVIGGDNGSAGEITCALTATKQVACWGGKAMLPPEPLHDVVSIAVGGGTGYVVKTDGTVWGWGSSAFNALADGTTANGPDKPLTQIGGITGATQVAAGHNHACALLGDRTVTCWGYASKAQAPVRVDKLSGVQSIDAESHGDVTCADTGTTRPCWGDDGVLGPPPAKLADAPAGAVAVAAGRGFACAALADGDAVCWGANDHGQLGDGTLIDRKTPVHVKGITLDMLPPAISGLDAVQDGPAPTAWSGLPSGCANGPIEITSTRYQGTTFTVKGAQAKADGKTVTINLADHALHPTGLPRGHQAVLGLRLAVRSALTVDRGAYTPDTKSERQVIPTVTTTDGPATLFAIGLPDAGKVTITHVDGAWICGELALAAQGASVRGSFAAPFTK